MNDEPPDSADLESQKCEILEERAAYKRAQQKRLGAYQVGKEDVSGTVITKILSRGDEYVVYEIDTESESEGLRVRIDTILEEDQRPIERLNAIRDEWDKFKSILYTTAADNSYKSRAAGAISRAITGDVDAGCTLLKQICEEATKEYHDKLKARLQYLSGAWACFMTLAVISVLSYVKRDSTFVATNPALISYLHASTFASIGGLISISIRLKTLNLGKTLDWYENLIYGAERILFAILGGIVIFTLLRAGLILEPLTSSTVGVYSSLAFCFIAGFSESFVPNALSNLGSRSAPSSK